MSVSVAVRVEGLARVVTALQRAGAEVDDLDMGRVAGGVISGYAAATPRRTGRLAGDFSIGTTRGKALLYAGTTVPYAGPINYGWPARGIAAADFVGRGDTVAEPKAIDTLEADIDRLIGRLDLN